MKYVGIGASKMSVMECSRIGCDNILCRRYSYTYGHLCQSCFDELCDSALTVGEFMNIPKPRNSKRESRYRELDEEFSTSGD